MKSSELMKKMRDYADYLELRDSMDRAKIEIIEALQGPKEEIVTETPKRPQGRPITNKDRILPIVRNYFEDAEDPSDLETAHLEIMEQHPQIDDEVLHHCLEEYELESNREEILGESWHGDE